MWRGFELVQGLLPRGHPLPEAQWARRHLVVSAVLWAWVVLLVPFSLVRGDSPLHALREVALVALPGVLALHRGLAPRTRAVLASLGVLTAAAVLVHTSGGYIEAHFAFFAMIPLITLYQSWLPFAVAGSYVLLHHGIVGVLRPEDVYNHPSAIEHPWRWAAIHAVALAITSGAAIAAWRLNEQAAEAREHDALRREADRRRRQQALEINDDIVQNLVVAKLSLELDDPERASAALDRTLESARGIIGDLLEHRGGGSLVRESGPAPGLPPPSPEPSVHAETPS